MARALAVSACACGQSGAQTGKMSAAEFQTALWASSCMACHGTDGRAEGTGMTLAGRPASTLLRILLAFKTGSREATVMHQHAKGYSDAELKRIAEYFSQVQ